MQVYGNFSQKVQIEPKDVIKKLIEKEIGWKNWVFEEDGKFYRGFEESAGCHSYDRKEEITQDKFEYVEALELILKRL
jgi:hypothetical protein